MNKRLVFDSLSNGSTFIGLPGMLTCVYCIYRELEGKSLLCNPQIANDDPLKQNKEAKIYI